MIRLAAVALVVLCAPLASVSSAAEGVLPLAAGDHVEGSLDRCGDRHVLRVDMARGERFKARVRLLRELSSHVTLRMYDPTGLEINGRARVRSQSSNVVVGPFRVTETGAHHIQLATFTRHGIGYEVRTAIARRGRKKLRLGGKRRERTVTAAAGSVIRVRDARGDTPIRIDLPGGGGIDVLPGTAAMDALLGAGLTVPTSGTVTVSLPEGGRARVVVGGPTHRGGASIDFPALPQDTSTVSAFYGDSGWVPDPRLTAAADNAAAVSITGESVPLPMPPDILRLGDATPAPATEAGRFTLADPTLAGGPVDGVGMPIAPIPTLADVVANGEQELFGVGPSYSYSVDDPALGALTYRVHFSVGGSPSLAPIALDGVVEMQWTVVGDASFHQGTWTLTTDAVRGVEVLDGSETRVDRSFRTVASRANAYLSPLDGTPAVGELRWAFLDTGITFERREIHDGTGGVALTIE